MSEIVDKERRNKVAIGVGSAYVIVESDEALEKCKKFAEEMINKISEKTAYGGLYG